MNRKNQFEKIYLKYFPILLVFGKTITKDEQIIEDTIHDLFAQIWSQKVDLSKKESVENYLIISLRNNLIRKLKKGTFNPINKDLIDLKEEGSIDTETRLLALLEKIPPRQKEVLFLRYYKGKSYQEIAKMLGITYQVARNFSYRAIKFLKKNLTNLHTIIFF